MNYISLILLIIIITLVIIYNKKIKLIADKNKEELIEIKILEKKIKLDQEVNEKELLKIEKEVCTLERKRKSDHEVNEKELLKIEKENLKLEKKLIDEETKYLKRRSALEVEQEHLLEEQKSIRKTREALEKEIYDSKKEYQQKLEEIALISQEQARRIIMQDQEKFLKKDLVREVKKYKNKLEIEKKSFFEQKIMDTIQTIDVEQISETNTRIIKLPSEDIKGRIIGRDGRNIKTIETLLGVNLIIDDTPKVITLSTFDPVRRAIASDALETLVDSGKINQIYIEKQVEKSSLKINDIIMQKGLEATDLFGLDDIDVGLIKKLGQLYFRTSLKQNVLGHSIECAKLAMKFASELGLDPKIAARAGLLHDIGKVSSQQTGLSHVDLGVEISKKYNESNIVINAIASHHGDYECDNVYSVIVSLCDKLSAGRPGARTEGYENFIERVTKLENIALGVDGVTKAYALQGAKELRMIVDAKTVDDEETVLIVAKVKRQIEEEMNFGGVIKINAFRELSIKDKATLVERHKEQCE